ncbi:MAG: hypothetical protein P8Y43_02590 [Sulfurovaceae bacterium]
MKKIILMIAMLLFWGCGNEKGAFLEEHESKSDYATTVNRLKASFALDLPLRVVIWRGYEGDVHLEYTNPEYWSLKHNIKDSDCLKILDQAVISMKNIADNTTK